MEVANEQESRLRASRQASEVKEDGFLPLTGHWGLLRVFNESIDIHEPWEQVAHLLTHSLIFLINIFLINILINILLRSSLNDKAGNKINRLLPPGPHSLLGQREWTDNTVTGCVSVYQVGDRHREQAGTKQGVIV